MSIETSGIDITAESFTYCEGQSSARVMAVTGDGNCFAYAKLMIINNVFFDLYVQVDADAGLHFGAVDSSEETPILHHLRSNHPQSDPMIWEEEVTREFYSDAKVIRVRRPKPFTLEKTYSLAIEEYERPSGLIVTGEPFLFLSCLGESYDPRDGWHSVLEASAKFDAMERV